MPIVLTRATKQEARYKALGGSEHCSACRFYLPQGTCGRIIGPVSPEGWCKYYSREMVQRWQPGSAGGNAALPPGVSLDLSFMTPGTLDPRITFTRASTATYTDASGTIQTAATNAPRWDYDPVTHQMRGLLIEEARTNVLLNSASLGTQGVAVTAQAYTLSFYGTGTIAYSGAASGSLVGAGTQRVSATFTPAAGTLTCTVTGSVLNAQLEAGSFATSAIITTAAAVTRAIDVCQMPTNVSWYNSNVGSLFGEYILEGASSSYSAPLAFVGANANTDFITTDSFAPGTATSPKLGGSLITANGTNQSYTDNGGTITIVAGIIQKGIGGWSPGTGVRSAHNGVPPTTYIGVVTTPPTIVGLTVGGQVNSQFAASMWARRAAYWPHVLSDAEMQQVTT